MAMTPDIFQIVGRQVILGLLLDGVFFPYESLAWSFVLTSLNKNISEANTWFICVAKRFWTAIKFFSRCGSYPNQVLFNHERLDV